MKDRGIIKASYEVVEMSDVMTLLESEIEIVEKEFDPWLLLEGISGTWTFKCRSEHFNENKNGPDHQYDILFTQNKDGTLSMEVTE